MEISPLKSVREQTSASLATPARAPVALSERFTDSGANDNSWRDQADQLNQLAQMARLRGYR